MIRRSLAVDDRVSRAFSAVLRRPTDRWMSLATWILCLVGTILLFRQLPKTFLPLGDSGFIWGFLLAEDSASPALPK